MMEGVYFVLLVTVLRLTQAQGQSYCTPTQCPSKSTYALNQVDRTTTNNYFYIGGILGVHESGAANTCGPLRPAAVQHIEALFWAVSTFKDRFNKLRNEEIGSIILDSCMQSSRAIQQILNLETDEMKYGAPAVEASRLMAWLGGETEEQASQLEQVLRSFSKILVSHAASSSKLSQEHPNLLRTVPSDSYQVNAIADILKRQQWNYIQVVYTDDDYGKSNKNQLMGLLSQVDTCITNEVVISASQTDQEMRDMVKMLQQQPKTKVVVLLLTGQTVKRILEAARAVNARGNFTWIGTTSWGKNEDVTRNVETLAEGAVTLDNQESSSAYDQFKMYWASKKPSDQDPNPWFKEYWQNVFSCTGNGCDYNSQSLTNIPLDKYVPYMIKAVDAVLNGIASASLVQCGSDQNLCPDFISYAGKWNIIRNKTLDVKIPGVRFDVQTGDILVGNYSVKNYRASDYDCVNQCYKQIGYYDSERSSNKLVMTDAINSYDSRGGLVRNVSSTCSATPCLICGEVLTVLPTTTSPPRYYDPNDVKHVSISGPGRIRKTPWLYALIVFASVGLLLVITLELYLLVRMCSKKYRQTWGSMWLGQTLLFGIFLGYLTLYAFIPEPSKATCGIIRFGVGVSYAICFSVLLVKLMVILSSEDGDLKTHFQVFMLFFTIGVQLVIDTEWLILRHPGAVYVNDEWRCKESYNSHIQSLVYVMFLILLVTVTSIFTHGIVTNHREGMFIGIAGGLSIPIWVAWVILGALNKHKQFEDPCIAYGLFITLTVVLAFMFIPKIRQLNGMSGKDLFLDDEVVEYAPTIVSKSPMGPGSVVMSPVGPASVAGDTVVYTTSPPIVKDGSLVLLNGDYANGTIPNGGFINGGFMNSGYAPSTVAYAEPVHTKPVHLHYDADPTALYLRHPGPPHNFRPPSAPASVRSAPVGNNVRHKSNLLKITRDLTGSAYQPPTISSENYGTSTRSLQSSQSGTIKRAKSIQDLGYL